MKNYKNLITALALTLITGSVNAQTINWASLKTDDKQIINLNMGAEHGIIYGLGYGYHFKSRLFPVIANLEYSFPSGDKILDDFKSKIGGQIRLVQYHNFQFSTKIHGVFRRYENDLVRLLDFGSDMSGIVGYYRSHWFFAAEVGFDKAIVTHFKHSPAYKDRFPGVVDGWYQPSTGGNFYYGLQTGFSLKHHDIYVKAGKILTQDYKTSPTVPFYAQVGYNLRFK